MKEYLDVLDETGNMTGITKLRDEVHRDGDWHLSIHLWMVSGDEILLQKRSVNKESYPGCYDASVAGHVSAGESITCAAVRECAEEIGLDISDRTLDELGVLKLCIIRNDKSFISNEYNHVLAAEIDKNSAFHIDEEEVENITWMPIDTVYEEIKGGNKQYCVSLEEIMLIRNRFGGRK